MEVFNRGGNTVVVTTNSNSAALDGIGDVLRVVNPTTIDSFLAVGIGAPTAATTDVLVPAKTSVYLRISFDDTHIAIRGTPANQEIYVMRGTAS